MANESPFVAIAQRLLQERLAGEPLEVLRGAVLLYQVTVDNELRVMSQERVRAPKRGDSAFQTDLCLFERKSKEVLLPRVVLEFKTVFTTHDVLTYSAKAERHKTIYPYLRYGLVASSEKSIPGRFFTHNEGLDFCLCLGGVDEITCAEALARLMQEELASSRSLEAVAFGANKSRVYRTNVVLRDVP